MNEMTDFYETVSGIGAGADTQVCPNGIGPDQAGANTQVRRNIGWLADDELALLTAGEAAQVLGCDGSMVYKLMRTGELEAVRFGRCVRVTRAAVRKFIREHSG